MAKLFFTFFSFAGMNNFRIFESVFSNQSAKWKNGCFFLFAPKIFALSLHFSNLFLPFLHVPTGLAPPLQLKFRNWLRLQQIIFCRFRAPPIILFRLWLRLPSKMFICGAPCSRSECLHEMCSRCYKIHLTKMWYFPGPINSPPQQIRVQRLASKDN